MISRAATPVDQPASPVPASGPVVLTRRRVLILPTRYGLVFALALLVMLLGSINYDNGLGYVLVFLLTSLALVSMLHTYRNIAGLRIRPGKVSPVFAGSDARFGVCIDNPRGHARFALHVHPIPPSGDRRRGVSASLAHIAPGETYCAEVRRRAAMRGRMSVGRITLATRFPLGLFRAWSPVALHAQCLVYPEPRGSLRLPASTALSEHAGTKRGRGREDFSGFRDYVRGDSPKRIHWKAVARSDGLPVKLFAGATDTTLTLRWEDVPERDVESRLSQLCQWVLEADRRQFAYALALPGDTIALGSGEEHVTRCLEALALFDG